MPATPKPAAPKPATRAAEPTTDPAKAPLTSDPKPKAAKGKAPAKAAPAKAPAIDAAEILPEGAVTDAPPSGAYLRVKVLDRPVGYVSPRRKGLLVEVLTSRLAGIKPTLMEGTTARQNQTALLVTDAKTTKQARALFAHAAASVKEVKS